MAHATFVKSARKDYPDQGIKKGESYYWWKFRYGGKHFSKTAPRQSQLTQSEFLSTIYSLEEQLGDLNAESIDDVDDLKSQVEDIVSQIREAGDECEEKRSNMPDQLQDSETGEMLQTRKDECDAFADELEAVSLDDFDGEESEAEGDEEKKTEAFVEWLESKIEELQGCSYNGE